MNSIDAIVMILFGFFAVRGFIRGLVYELISLGGILSLIIFVTNYVDQFQDFISKNITPINYWTALVTGLLLIMITTGSLSIVVQGIVKALNISLIDRILGFFMGIFFGIFFVFLGLRLLLFVSENFNWTSLKVNVDNWIDQSQLLQTILDFLGSILSKGTNYDRS